MNTSQAVRDMSLPLYTLYRPGEDNNYRPALDLTGGPVSDRDALALAYSECDDPLTHMCYLEPLTTLEFPEVYKSDSKRIKRIMKKAKSGPLTRKDLPFLAVSWSPRHPDQLLIESRRAALRYGAYTQCVEASLDPDRNPDRSFFVMTFLKPKKAIISKY